ncbi:MAG: hypothetical protein ACYTGY_12590 [Planctomycetota bacterium]|jgi:hypothetical protein
MIVMTTDRPTQLTPFAMRVMRRLLDSSLTWREIVEAFTVPARPIEGIQRGSAQPGSIRRACRSEKPAGP